MAAIVVDGVTKHFGSVTALDRVDLTVEAGEVFGFLGPNGAGKSTMINVFLDFVKPTDGSASIFGHDCQAAGVEARRRMGVLPEQYGLYDRLSGLQHVEYAIASKAADDHPMELMDRVGLSDAAGRTAGEYSKGMAQRLVLAMALAGDPDLLVLDEPTTGLDPRGAKSVREIIREEQDRGATVFFSSHILEQVEAVSDRVGILHEGQLVAIDSIEGLRASLGGGTKLTIDVDHVDERTLGAVEAIDGVDSAWLGEEGEVEVTCRNDVKIDVLIALNDDDVDILNVTTEEASLEELFVEYTGGTEA